MLKSVKFGMSILYAMTCLLFLALNTSVGVMVIVWVIKYDLGFLDFGVDIYLLEVFIFFFGDIVLNMWCVGVYTFALFIFLFFGVWSYVKFVVMWIFWLILGFDLCVWG